MRVLIDFYNTSPILLKDVSTITKDDKSNSFVIGLESGEARLYYLNLIRKVVVG